MPTDRTAGLSTAKAKDLLARYGPNAVPEARQWPVLVLVGKFWAPIPWMLEAAVVLELFLGKAAEAGIIGSLLVFNAAVAFVQENRAQAALDLLRQRLEIRARVLRDGSWQRLGAPELVPGDVVHLRMGDMVPADILLEGPELLLDQSTLTGEALPIEAEAGAIAYAGTLVKRGEATGEVVATGTSTRFGKTAELVRTARATGHLQRLVFSIVETLLPFNGLVVLAVVAYALWAKLPSSEFLPFALILLVASIPVALPATFTLAGALGALELARDGVLVPRLSAIEEAAALDVLCCDKTGTITQNRLSVGRILAYSPHSEDAVLRLAALASDAATQDPIDLAVLRRATAERAGAQAPANDEGEPAGGTRSRDDRQGVQLFSCSASGKIERLEFIPFEPATKRSEAMVRADGRVIRVAKGAHMAIAALCAPVASLEDDAARLAASGMRVLAVAAGEPGDLHLAGLLALVDPPRLDSAEHLRRLAAAGVRVLMLTGDSAPTARSVAQLVGIGTRLCEPERLRADPAVAAASCDVFAGILPEDKFNLVKSLQDRGYTVGMTGDGINDAPALKQAEVGIAVENATDVAKAAASIVLTRPGLAGIVTTIETSRRIYQRMFTYTLNRILKSFEVALFLSLALVITGKIVITPLLIVLLLFANDFVTMSLSTDNVRPSPRPDRWEVRPLMQVGLALAAMIMAIELGVFLWQLQHLRLDQLPTLAFLLLVFTSQAGVYMVRERGHFWSSRPSRWILLASVLDLLVVSTMAIEGILMAPLPPVILGETFGAIASALVCLDFVKIAVFRYLGASRP